MRTVLMVLVLTLVTTTNVVTNLFADDTTGVKLSKHLQDISVTIVTQRGEGSGEIITRKMPEGYDLNFVWTAAHVVDNSRHIKKVIDSKSGLERVVVEFDDVMIVKSYKDEGRTVGKSEFYAEVVRFSSEEDLALLRVRQKNFTKANVVFDLKQDTVPIGTPLYHMGSLLGQLGSNSMTTGIMSQHGRLIDKKVFDQTTVAAFPGSSGGGVYESDGKMCGLVVRGAGETFNLIVPMRRIREWAKGANIEWALDEKIKMPNEGALRKLPIEDNGITFSYSVQNTPGSGGKTLIQIIGQGRYYLGNRKTEEMFPTYFIMTNDTVPKMPKIMD